MVNCAVSCIKYVIFAFNFLCFIIGISLLGGGIYVVAAGLPTEFHVGDVIFYVPAVPYVLIGVGVFITVIAFLGCCGAVMENTCMLMSFSIVMLALLVAQLGFGLYGLINYQLLIENGLMEILHASKGQKELQNAWEALQNEYQCCGVNQPSDWKPIYGDNLPWTCCPKYWSDPEALAYAYALPGCRAGDATKVGCKEKLVQYVKEHLIVWLALGFTATILIQFIGILFTCILFYAFRKKDHELRLVRNSLRYRSNIQAFSRPTAPTYAK